MGGFLACFGACLAKIPWWVWLIIAVVGFLLGIVGAIYTAVTAGATLAAVLALVFTIKFLLAGLGGAALAVAAVFGTCAASCVKG